MQIMDYTYLHQMVLYIQVVINMQIIQKVILHLNLVIKCWYKLMLNKIN